MRPSSNPSTAKKKKKKSPNSIEKRFEEMPQRW
jgi:hypothetical protein